MKGDKAFRWYGGKGQISGRIIKLLPPHKTYVEGCAGSASILMAKEPSKTEVLNDVNGDLVNFYRVLRDPELCQKLIHLCDYTPYSREEFEAVRSVIKNSPDPNWQRDDLVLRAWTWFVWTAQSYSPGHGRNTFGVKTVSDWLSSVSKLDSIGNRLRGVTVENGDWRLVADTYDEVDALLYLDPPYLIETRSDKGDHYAHEMNTVDHMQLLRRVVEYKGMVMISGHHHQLYDKWLVEDRGWECLEFKVNTISNASRIDVLWSNPSCVKNRLSASSSQIHLQIDFAIEEARQNDATKDELLTIQKMKELMGEDFAITYAGQKLT